MSTRARVWEALNDPRSAEMNREGLALLEPLPPSPALLDAFANVAFDLAVAGRHEEAIATAERALLTAADAGLPRPARALGFRGWSRCCLGDAGGLSDFREALALAVQTGRGREEATLINNLGIELRNFEGPRVALETFATGLEVAEARGMRDVELNLRGSALPAMLGAGALEDLLDSATLQIEHAEEAEVYLIEIRSVQAVALTYRGDADEARHFLGALVEAVRRTGRHDLIAPALGTVAVVRAALGESALAAAILREVDASLALTETTELAPFLAAIVRAACAIGELDLAERLTGRVSPRSPYTGYALIAARAAIDDASGRTEAAAAGYAEAASCWERFGVIPEEGFALLGLGRCLLALGRPEESADALHRARELFTPCGMRPALEETQTLLARATPLSS